MATRKSDAVGEKGRHRHVPLFRDTAARNLTEEGLLVLPCRLTSELTGAQRHCAARRTLTSTHRGAMPLRVRVERLVRAHDSSLQLPRPRIYGNDLVERVIVDDQNGSTHRHHRFKPPPHDISRAPGIELLK